MIMWVGRGDYRGVCGAGCVLLDLMRSACVRALVSIDCAPGLAAPGLAAACRTALATCVTAVPSATGAVLDCQYLTRLVVEADECAATSHLLTCVARLVCETVCMPGVAHRQAAADGLAALAAVLAWVRDQCDVEQAAYAWAAGTAALLHGLAAAPRTRTEAALRPAVTAAVDAMFQLMGACRPCVAAHVQWMTAAMLSGCGG